ncbi:hypothetical protein BJ912DRAFT_1060916 [Pholiota molesta]|nr:hypothetical protein BJ912DRAFT_1060916 [Pholiota molesta]
MPILTPSELPIELIEKIIDETFYSQVSSNTRSKSVLVDPKTVSSLARVSHIFRQRINAHRFSILFFQRSDFAPPALPHIHAFLDLLQSEVWIVPSMGVARHVRKLVLILGENSNPRNDTVPHRAIDDGPLITIMNTIFRRGEGYPDSTSNYTLALWGFAEWQGEVISPEVISNIESLLDSRITTLELKWLNAVPPTLLKGRHVKHISISSISFQWTLNSQHVPEYTALGPCNHLESLDINTAAGFFNLIAPGDISMLKSLTVTQMDSSMANSILYHWQHWNVLEDLTLNFYNNHTFSHFHVDYRHLSLLTRLTINLLLVEYNSSSIVSSIESSTHQILNLLEPHLPPLSRLEIFIDRAAFALFRESDPNIRLVNDIPTEIDCASIDAVLAQYPPSAISTITIQFGIKLSRGVEAAPALDAFRQDGLDVLREAFPRLNAGPRRRVYDSEVSTTETSRRWEEREQENLPKPLVRPTANLHVLPAKSGVWRRSLLHTLQPRLTLAGCLRPIFDDTHPSTPHRKAIPAIHLPAPISSHSRQSHSVNAHIGGPGAVIHWWPTQGPPGRLPTHRRHGRQGDVLTRDKGIEEAGHTPKVDGDSLTYHHRQPSSSVRLPPPMPHSPRIYVLQGWRAREGSPARRLPLIPAFGTLYQRLALPESKRSKADLDRAKEHKTEKRDNSTRDDPEPKSQADM